MPLRLPGDLFRERLRSEPAKKRFLIQRPHNIAGPVVDHFSGRKESGGMELASPTHPKQPAADKLLAETRRPRRRQQWL